jgi:aspartate aminotransferase
MADYAIFIDGISKSFAATGLRVGWSVGPASVIDAMSRILGHVGAWAPKAEQVATAQLLNDDAAVDEYVDFIRDAAGSRLALLHERLSRLQQQGWPIRALEPQGSIYLSAEFSLRGMRTDGDRVLQTPHDVRIYLLEQAGLAMVPFDAFGAHHADDWYRLSVGAVSIADLEAMFDRLDLALQRLRPAQAA